jgi:hypothetical protein
MSCTDIRGFANITNSNTWGGHFYDNGHYIGHDEPDVSFLSNVPGSGGNVFWNITLGTDPAASPTTTTPGSDVSHWFELTPAFWFSMALCDPWSYPQMPCTPQSDSNAPNGSYPGGGSAFLELQFYPPGFAPFVDAVSCNNLDWCAALTIDSLSCTDGFAVCNANCEEPVNFAFLQSNGIPTGPPGPQTATIASFTPDSRTLMMAPGDSIEVHLFDAPVPGNPGQYALETVVNDLTTGASGYMQASALNGFEHTDITNCAGTPFNFQPEYSTSTNRTIIPWAALATNIGASVETGHFEPCATLAAPFTTNPYDPQDTGGTYNSCIGNYENSTSPDSSTTSEVGDGVCYYANDVHTGYNGSGTSTAPDEVTGCLANYDQNGDLDFDGTPYWSEWPVGSQVTASLPGSFQMNSPTSGGSVYPQLFFQTDVALSEGTCTATNLTGCAVPPPVAPGKFYPYWSSVVSGGSCTWEFGNVSTGTGVDNQGLDTEYGADQFLRLGYPEIEGKTLRDPCAPPPPPTFHVGFQETGLPVGTSWSVTLNGTLQSATGPVISFPEYAGSYPYSVVPIPGYTTSYTGQVQVSATNVTVTVAFVPMTYPVTFSETGLPAGTLWTVDLGGSINASTGVGLGFQKSNGTYAVAASASGFRALLGIAPVQVAGSSVAINVVFTPVEFVATFSEAGLPAGTQWSVSLAGTLEATTGGSLTFSLANGSYAFNVGGVTGYTVSPSTGTVTVRGTETSQQVTFAPVVPVPPPTTYPVAFEQTGLGSGTLWGIEVAGSLHGATTSGITTNLANGSYSYAVEVPLGFLASPAGGNLNVSGSGATVAISFAAVPAPTAPVTHTVYNNETPGAILTDLEFAELGIVILGLALAAVVVVLTRNRPRGGAGRGSPGSDPPGSGAKHPEANSPPGASTSGETGEGPP